MVYYSANRVGTNYIFQWDKVADDTTAVSPPVVAIDGIDYSVWFGPSANIGVGRPYYTTQVYP